MYVVIADQVASRTGPDLAGEARDRLAAAHGERLVLPPDRTAGDEVQAITADAGTAFAMALELTRGEDWSVGVGVGPVRMPLPRNTREATGPAFFAARDAVVRAKSRQTRFALQRQRAAAATSATTDAEPLIDLLLVLRQRRSAAGWELYDLLATGISQRQAAARLGISAPSVSDRARAASLRAEADAVPALVRLMEQLDADDDEGA